MSKKHSAPESHSEHPNVTPLIDVVMCLIIFFMLVAKIGVTTGATPLPLPETILGKKIEELGDSMILNIYDPNFDRDGKGERKIDETTGKPVRFSTTSKEPMVTALLDKNEKEAKEIKLTSGTDKPLQRVLKAALAKNKDFSVTLRAEKDLDFGMMQQVLADVANAGVQNLNYGAKTKTVTEPAAH